MDFIEELKTGMKGWNNISKGGVISLVSEILEKYNTEISIKMNEYMLNNTCGCCRGDFSEDIKEKLLSNIKQ